MKNEELIDVLLVEDEETLALIIKDTLEGQGFRIRLAKDGEEGLRLFFQEKPDVLVADVMMPRMDSFEMVRRLRKSDSRTPVLFLTARSAVNDVVEGFELGGNDYLKKPFGMQELIVRVRALLGRAFVSPAFTPQVSAFEIGSYRFDCKGQTLSRLGVVRHLSHRESEILHRLCINRDQVTDMRQILLDLWGDDTFFNQRSLHVFIAKLRRKLADDGHIRIVNVRGMGYKLIVE